MTGADLRRAICDLEDDLATALARAPGDTTSPSRRGAGGHTRRRFHRGRRRARSTGIDRSELEELYEQIVYGVPGEIEAAHRRFAQDLARLLREFKRALAAMETQGAPR